jgi:hypothetical protein
MYNAGLAQSVERQALNLVVVGSSPTAGGVIFTHRWEIPKIDARRIPCAYITERCRFL